ERLTQGESVTDAGVAGDPLGQLRCARERQGFEQLLSAFVHEPEASLEVDDRFALDREAKVPGLDDAGVHRSNGDFEDAWPLDATKRKWTAVIDDIGARHGVTAERMIAVGPELGERQPTRIGMAGRHEAEEILNLALEPAGRG